MGWAAPYVAKLQAGETVKFRPRGNSMRGKINLGDLCTVVPLVGERADCLNAVREEIEILRCAINEPGDDQRRTTS